LRRSKSERYRKVALPMSASRTQPHSIGMPALGTENLSEERMWGLTLLDQLACRIDFAARA
jgi:glucose dehydrogenase